MATDKCPKCGKQMVQMTRPDKLVYKRRSVVIDQPGRWCPDGHEAIFTQAELEIRDQARIALRERVDAELAQAAMSPAEVKRIRAKLGMSQAEASKLLGGGPNAFDRYESGRADVSAPMANLLRLLDHDPNRIDELRKAS